MSAWNKWAVDSYPCIHDLYVAWLARAETWTSWQFCSYLTEFLGGTYNEARFLPSSCDALGHIFSDITWGHLGFQGFQLHTPSPRVPDHRWSVPSLCPRGINPPVVLMEPLWPPPPLPINSMQLLDYLPPPPDCPQDPPQMVHEFGTTLVHQVRHPIESGCCAGCGNYRCDSFKLGWVVLKSVVGPGGLIRALHFSTSSSHAATV